MERGVKRILMTGGHAATTAIAVVQEIKRTKSLKKAEIYFIGSRWAMEGFDVETLEYKTLPKIGVDFYPIITGRLQTKFTRYTLLSIFKIPFGFIHALYALMKIRPSVVLSFGGFASFPVVFWSYIFDVPILVHEQTIAAGRATILSSFFAKKILLAREESLNYFPNKNKCIVIGNPIIKEIVSLPQNFKMHSPPRILFMGGSRGSSFINKLAVSLMPMLLKKYQVVHITGEKDFSEIVRFKSTLPKVLVKNYKIFPAIEPFQMAGIYEDSDLVIARAGANSVSEILYLKKPAIFIPLALSFADEQTKNAKYAESFGFVRVVSESKATSKTLIDEISDIFKNYDTILKKASDKTSLDSDASKKIVDILSKY